jgi:hypothetical protein
MLRKFKSLRRDYPAMLAALVILLGTFVLEGIAYTYTHRSRICLMVANFRLTSS